MNLLKKIIYFCLSIKEKRLAVRLDKHYQSSATNRTSKTVLDGNVKMTLTTETEKNKELVLKSVTEIVKGVQNNPYMLLAYIESHGTKVVKLANADKVLSVISEDEGLVCEQKGWGAFYLNVLTDEAFAMTSKPMFVLRDGEIEPYYMLHQFYKWFALHQGLPGFDFEAQRLFKKYLNAPDSNGLENLNLEEMTALKEAIDRDNEAIDFTVGYANSIDGSKNVLNKIKEDGGANI